MRNYEGVSRCFLGLPIAAPLSHARNGSDSSSMSQVPPLLRVALPNVPRCAALRTVERSRCRSMQISLIVFMLYPFLGCASCLWLAVLALIIDELHLARLEVLLTYPTGLPDDGREHLYLGECCAVALVVAERLLFHCFFLSYLTHLFYSYYNPQLRKSQEVLA